MQVVKYVFQPHSDERGQLVALEEIKDIPFKIKRVYYMYDTKDGVVCGYLFFTSVHFNVHLKGRIYVLVCDKMI